MGLPDAVTRAERSGASAGHASGDESGCLARPQPRILLLDDDSFMLGTQARMLHAMGCTSVRTAGSAEAALSMLAANADAVDLIFCDLNMPGMDGIEFLQVLKAKDFCGSVILLSGEGVRIMHTVQRLLGGSRMVILGALEKPAGRAPLRALLERWRPSSEETATVRTLTFSAAELLVAHRARQWVLHYQPKVDLKTGEFVGMEALVRWDHPDHGLVYPDSFIGLAEDCGVIDGLTEWVLEEALRQQARWRAPGRRMQMAVNVSMENLRAPDFAWRVGDIARRFGGAPEHVTFEITESRVMAPSLVPLESLVRLRMQRFRLSVDDFGTGHSTLVQLRDVPFTELKIDRGFVKGARHNPVIRPILEGSIGIAKRMDMLSVAEGVETEDDWHLLREIGCDLAQGWFVGRAMAADRFEGWLEQWEFRRGALVQG